MLTYTFSFFLDFFFRNKSKGEFFLSQCRPIKNNMDLVFTLTIFIHLILNKVKELQDFIQASHSKNLLERSIKIAQIIVFIFYFK